MTAWVLALLTVFTQQGACERLLALSFPNTMVTAAEIVPAGPARTGRGGQAGADLPAHCRVAAVLTPSPDSRIGMELWLPLTGWNGKFLAVGNGGWAGNIETGAIGVGLRRGYAAASNDTGHRIHLNTSQVSLQVDMLRDPSLLVSPAKITLLANAVIEACDGLDGLRDSIVSDPESCRFDPAVLLCKEGSADCFTARELESARRSYAPVTASGGKVVYPGRSFGYESGWRIPTPGTPLNPLFADMPRYIAHGDANWDPMSFDLERDLALALENAGFIEASDPDLAEFRARGGKLILYHGWADPGPAPQNTIDYHRAVAKSLGGDQKDWMRLFLMPGVAHCGGGTGADQADFLGALERWREDGAALDSILATRASRAGEPPMSRPLCPYPEVPRYVSGAAGPNDARSFVCSPPANSQRPD